MARLFARVALLSLALASQLLVPLTRADPDPNEPVNLYEIDGVVKQNIFQGQNTSLPVYSTDFDYAAIEQLSQRLSATQGFVEAASAVPNTILLRIPLPDTTGPEQVRDLVGRFNYLGPADPADPSSTLLGMYGLVEGVAPAPGDPAADRNFYLWIDPTYQWVQGGAVLGDTYVRFETINNAVVITAFPFEIGLCRLYAEGAAPEPGSWEAKKNMTKSERWAYKQELRARKKLARQEKRNATKAARAEKRASKRADKQRKWGNKRDLELEQTELLPRLAHEHGHGHAHEGPDFGGHDHQHDHMEVSRQLQTGPGRLLVFIDTAPQSGVYAPWNGGNPVTITTCPTDITVTNLPRILAAVREDFAPFNIEVTTDRAAFNAAGGRKVTVNLVYTAIGVINQPNVCGVAYLNSLSWANNVVWAACGCGLSVIPQIIAHEVGHIFDLRHDGISTTTQQSSYLFGLPYPSTLPSGRRWNAIMGGAANVGLDQWSRGQYTGATTTQDDMGIIVNRVGARVSTANSPAGCTTTFAHRDLSAVASTVTTTYPTAVITCGGGSHSYPMRIRGRYAIEVTPPAEGNMKFQVTFAPAVLRSGQWVASTNRPTVLGSNDAYASTSVTYTAPTAVTAGNYIITIRSVEELGNSNTYPFPSYGSVGSYAFRIRNGL